MKIDNVKMQMRKGLLDYCVLLLLNRGPAYTTDIIEQFKSADLIVVEGTLYPLLLRLKREGYLSYEWQESPQGPPRKYYALSDKGREALAVMEEAWSSLTHTVTLLQSQNLSQQP